MPIEMRTPDPGVRNAHAARGTGMDMVYIIITVMGICAAACAIVLVWPERAPRDREPTPAARPARDPHDAA
jgi:hypothetical protein